MTTQLFILTGVILSEQENVLGVYSSMDNADKALNRFKKYMKDSGREIYYDAFYVYDTNHVDADMFTDDDRYYKEL